MSVAYLMPFVYPSHSPFLTSPPPLFLSFSSPSPVTEYPAFLEHLLPVFESLIRTVPVQSVENAQHSIRYVLPSLLPSLLPFTYSLTLRTPTHPPYPFLPPSLPSLPFPRHAVIDMLERLLPSDTLSPHKERLLTLALDVVRKDNEENAVLGAKVRPSSLRPSLPCSVVPSISFVCPVFILYRTLLIFFLPPSLPPSLDPLQPL